VYPPHIDVEKNDVRDPRLNSAENRTSPHATLPYAFLPHLARLGQSGAFTHVPFEIIEEFASLREVSVEWVIVRPARWRLSPRAPEEAP